ncbi:hypothetical protein GGX14DRAFT_450706 [Mycena pura]|uniref:Uncharacterized protein n=1 Tax=Mycena pura TaxID=153505 RepID=A0AAD6VHY4_9AGAR|nr:hypothetical protein GGX14DRAFT_450706 [Mycena pura]
MPVGCGARAHSQLLIRFCWILSLAQVVLSLANVISVSIPDLTLALAKHPRPTPSLHAAGPVAAGPGGSPGLPGDVGPAGKPSHPGRTGPPPPTSTDIPATASLKSTSATLVSSSPKALHSTRSQSSRTSTTTSTTIRHSDSQLSSSDHGGTFLFPTVSCTSADPGFPSISAVSPLGSSKPSTRVNKAAIAAGVVLSAVMLALAVACFLLYRRRQRARARMRDARASVTTQSSLFSHSVLVSVPSSNGYSYTEEKGDGADADPFTKARGSSPLPPFAVSDYDDVVRPSTAFAFGTGIQTETRTRDGAGAAGLSGSPPIKPLDRTMVAP